MKYCRHLNFWRMIRSINGLLEPITFLTNCACVCDGFCMITQKLLSVEVEHVVKISDKFDVRHNQIKVKVITGLGTYLRVPHYKL